MVSMLVFSQASPALATTNAQFRPITQYSSVGADTRWTISWGAIGWVSWEFDYGDGHSDYGTSGGNFSKRLSHRFGGCGRYWQSLQVTDYSSYPYSTFYYLGWTYIYCS